MSDDRKWEFAQWLLRSLLILGLACVFGLAGNHDAAQTIMLGNISLILLGIRVDSWAR